MGSTSQQGSKFSVKNRGKQCTSNSLTFLLHQLITPGDKGSKATIDAVLSIGDRVHTALTTAFGRPGERLSIEEMQTAIKMVGESNSIWFPQSILTGDVFSMSSDLPFVTLKAALQSALQISTGALLRIMEYTVVIQKLPEGIYALFDPHSRNQHGFVDGNGSAVIMTFFTLDSTVKYIRKFVRQKGSETEAQASEDSLCLAERSFEVLAIDISNPHVGPQNNSCLSRLIKGTSVLQPR